MCLAHTIIAQATQLVQLGVVTEVTYHLFCQSCLGACLALCPMTGGPSSTVRAVGLLVGVACLKRLALVIHGG